MTAAQPNAPQLRNGAAAMPDWHSLPTPVLVLSASGEATSVNAAFSDFTGLAAEAARGRGWQSVIAAAARAPLLGALAARADFTQQLALCRRDGNGSEAWVDCIARWLPVAERYLCQMHDVSAVRMAEAGAREQAQQLRLVANNVPALIALYAADDFRCLFANAGYAAAFGLTEQSILGKTFEQIIGADAARMVQPYVDEVHKHGRPARYERQLKTKSGDTQWIEVQMVPHLADDGTVLAAFVLVNDITRHREAERAVRESEERLAKFMQASVEGIVFHKNGVITDVNPPILALTGYALDDIIGRKTLEFIAPEHIPKSLEVMAAGAETAFESVLLHRDSMRIPVEFIVRTIERSGEKLRMTIVRDLRDRDAARSHIYHLAHHDALTGLLNRMAFMERLETLMGSGRPNYLIVLARRI